MKISVLNAIAYVFGLIALSLLIVWGIILNDNKTSCVKEKVKVGQIWVYCDNRDPFKKPIIDTIEVLEIKNGYAKVVDNKDTTSTRLDLVSFKGKLIKK